MSHSAMDGQTCQRVVLASQCLPLGGLYIVTPHGTPCLRPHLATLMSYYQRKSNVYNFWKVLPTKASVAGRMMRNVDALPALPDEAVAPRVWLARHDLLAT